MLYNGLNPLIGGGYYRKVYRERVGASWPLSFLQKLFPIPLYFLIIVPPAILWLKIGGNSFVEVIS